MNIQTEIDLHLDRIERETWRPKFHGLIIKFQALKSAVCDLFKSREEAYKQLMLAEIALEEVEPSPQAARALEYIAKAKGFLAALVLLGACINILDLDDDLRRVRRVRRQKEEYFAS